MITLLLAVQLTATPVPCPTPQPGPSWVCQGGGWLPPGHPDIVVPPPPPPPPPTARFRVGRRYVRGPANPYNGDRATDVFIAGAGQLADGTPVLVAECLTVGDGCFTPGYLRLFLTTTTSADWTEVPLP